MAKKHLPGIWSITKKIFFCIFVLHTALFIYFIVQKFPVTGFTVANLEQKVLLVCGGLIVLGLVYYFWLRHIGPIKKAGIIVRELFFICYISSTLYLFLGVVFNPPITVTQVGSLLQGRGLKRDYISLEEMSPNVKLALMASEDQLFPDHDGFDLKAIKLAMKYNKRHPNRVRGASTISQQVAKNVFLWQHGGFFRKGLEVYFTFSVELVWSKKIILERYLNIAEMGSGVFGIQAAAKKYFNKNARDLSRVEAAQIIACLPNPKVYTVKPLSRYVASKYDDILRQMNNLEGDPDIEALIR